MSTTTLTLKGIQTENNYIKFTSDLQTGTDKPRSHIFYAPSLSTTFNLVERSVEIKGETQIVTDVAIYNHSSMGQVTITDDDIARGVLNAGGKNYTKLSLVTFLTESTSK